MSILGFGVFRKCACMSPLGDFVYGAV